MARAGTHRHYLTPLRPLASGPRGLHEDDTPKLVIIDEAIEIAKKFGTQKSSQFINGILDGILKRYNLAS